MAKRFRISGYHYNDGNVIADIDFSKFENRFETAQRALGEVAIRDARPIMAYRTGRLYRSAYVDVEKGAIVYPQPYAAYVYKGIHTDKKTGNTRPIHYTNPNAVPYWLEQVKISRFQFWLQMTKDIIGGKKNAGQNRH